MTREVGKHAGKWTPERIKEAQDLLFAGMSLTKAAQAMGITRKALTDALVRHNAMPRRAWI
jgi:hypothetical protein